MSQLSFRSPKTQVRTSAIHGKGLFATAPIKTGDIVCIKGGYVHTQATWSELEQKLGPAEIQISETHFIAPSTQAERDGAMLYINHSCDPNCAIQGQIVFVAMRDIAAEEELTHDWATTDDLDYAMTCHCQSSNCRGTITGRDWMKPELQARYAGWFCWFLQRRIDSMRKPS
ncbi:MAG: SET domain-containing protein-lysine N-methyltransferase [Proteobacteria bacterium]|nr:SET domain-containing protein-lysine N-methyltransferase [Pseudomonadota bacterium]